MPAPPPVPGRRLALRPGLPVVRRDDRHLQVGVDAPHRTVLEDTPDVRRLLADLQSSGRPAPTTAAGHQALLRLTAAGHLVDADVLEAALGDAPDRAATAAAFALHGDAAPERLADRARVRAEVTGPEGAVRLLTRLLGDCGAGPTEPSGEGAVAVVVADGEVGRDRLDPLVRAGLPHLLVSLGGTSVTIGPFVVPGLTACVRCVDAHRGERDPRRATVVDQAARSGDLRPRDPALAMLALAWAVRDVTAWSDGEQPSTWSRTVTVGTDLQPVAHAWTRHPHCGCAWDEALVG
ncbi:TOMM precursor leader peptide-binding protein [Nocardioides sp. KIGAM211]|uniref:TOMM leader peptide-binding protein n=1 Tax=Nocardioides luti TaxID=2761101 RepID=A0A7X0RJ60_9ACTN|nr:TOMM precursor leader peptide-binding protein [Nocardioides luti]